MDNNWKEFTLGDLQEEQPKRIAPKRKKRRWLFLGIAAAVALIAVAVALLWDQSSFDGLRRSIIYAKAQKDESGCARLYEYTGDNTSRFAVLDGSLATVSAQDVLLQGEGGTVLYQKSVHFLHPAMECGGGIAAAYDIGGTEVYVMDSRGLLWSEELGGEIYALSVSRQGQVAVTYHKSGYKAAVCVYDTAGQPQFEYDSADRFVADAALSRDGRSLASATVGQQDGEFCGALVLYKLTSEKPTASLALKGSLVYDVGTVDSNFCAVTDTALYFATPSGSLTGFFSYGDDYLRRCSLSGNGYAALLLGHYRTGSLGTLLTVDCDGAELARMELDGEVLDMSAAGRYIAVLYADHLSIYDKALQEVANLPDVSTARQVLMREDGSAVLAGTSGASLYLP